MQRFSPFGAVITVLFSAALVPTSPAQNIGTARVNGAPQINSGRVEGNVHQMMGANMTLNGSAVITGDLLVPGTPTLIKNGTPNFGGTIVGTGSTSPSNYQVILNGSVTLGRLRTRTNPVAIPALSPVPSPTGTRTVTITAAGQSAGNFSTLRNLTLNGNVGQYTIPAGTYGDFIANGGSGFTLGVAGATQATIYNLQRLTLNGQTKIIVLGPVVINVANGFTANGIAGTSTNPAWLKLNVVAGGFTLNGGCNIYGYINAPSGTVIINGAAKLVGGCISAGLTVNATGLLQLFDATSFDNQPPAVAITSPAAGAVFNAGSAITLVASATDTDGSVTKVEFFAGTTKLGEATSSPWTYTWQNAVAGSYQLTAIATDNLGAKTTSAAVSISVNAPPTVGLTAPANQSVFQAGSVILLTANAADSDGTIQKVEFFADGTKLGEKTTAPYSFSWNNALAGPHALTARAIDNNGAQTVSATVNIRVNAPPSATMTAPTNGSVVHAGSVIPLAANASDSDGTITKVEFYAGATKVGEDTTAPYQFNWSNAAAGHYSITARAIDNDGAQGTSAPVTLTINAPPAVAITAPAAAQVFNPGATISITASPSDPDGTVTKVEFFSGTTKIGETGAAPWTISWPAPVPGVYQLSAKATDDLGAHTTSSIVSIRINAPPAVTITAPADQAVVQPGNSIALTANASDSDGTVAKVEFFAGDTKLGESSSAPFNFSWSNAISGSYTITAKATDNDAASTISAPTQLRVNALPEVALTAPAQGSTFRAGEAIPVSAHATDSDDGISKVEFFAGSTKIGEASTAPYSISWVGAPEGASILTARATDGSGANATSAAVTIDVTRINSQITVDAGPDRLISLPGAATLEGQALLNGGPSGPEVVLEWSLVSGPGPVTFSAPNSSTTSVSFTQAGNYILRLTASNIDGANFDTVAVTVLAAPQVGPDSPVSNQGREFWMAFLSGSPPSSEPDHAGAFLFITSEVAATGTVEIFQTYYDDGGAWQSYTETQNFAVAAGSKTLVEVDDFWQPMYDNQFDQAVQTSVHILADAPVAVHALSSSDSTTDGSLILPTGMLGRDYFIMSYNNSLTFHPNSQQVIGGTELAVVATHNETQVTITPTASTVAHPAGQPFTVTLRKGDVYRMINKTDVAGDFTGTRVQSDKPVAVYGGHACATVPGSTAACDHLYEQMTPVDFWGRHFVTLPLATRHNGDRFRALAATDNTHVSINGQIVAILNRGQFYETVLAVPASIVADQRILLAQFAQSSAVDNTTGDPFMALVPPYEEFGRHYILNTQALHSYWYGGYRDIYDSYLSVIVDSAHAGSVSVNGQAIASSQFVPIGDSGFSGATISLAKDSTFDISSPTPIGTWIYGWAPYESYGYTGGLYAELNAGSAHLELTQSSSAAPIGRTHRVRAQFNNAASLPVPSARVDFAVTGSNPATGFGYTAADGSVEFSWMGAHAGTDIVTATAGTLTATATVNWLSNPSNQPPQANAGPDKLVKLGDPLTLQGLVQDDGLPAGEQLVSQWSALPGWGDVTFSNPSTVTTTATFIYPGQYHLRLTAYDGQFSGDDEMLVNVDIPPAFTDLTTSDLVIDQGKQWNVRANARDVDGTIVRVELLDGAQVLAMHEQNNPQVSNLSLSTVFTTIGLHLVTVRLTDDLGATTDRTFEVTVRPTPTVQILSPADNTSIAAGGSVSFTASASSAGGAITRVVYEDVTVYPYEIGDGTGSDYQFTYYGYYAATRLIAATAYDSAGASGTSTPIAITVLSPGDPTVTITSPQEGSSFYIGQWATFRANATAVAPANVGGVSFFDDYNYLGNSDSPPYETQWYAGSTGAHTLQADVWDSFGGYASTSITVNIIEPPDLSITLVEPPPNIPIKVNTPTTLEAAIENVIGTLNEVDFYVNGGWIGGGSSSSVTWTPPAVGVYEIGVVAYSSDPEQSGYIATNITVADLHSPVVQWTAPANGASFAPNTSIVLQAQASDIDSNLAKLQFIADGQMLSETPLSGGAGVASFTWDNAGPGWHALTAFAVDDTLQTGSAFARIFVQRMIRNDVLPPSDLTATPASTEVILNWTEPAQTGAVGTVIERKLGRLGVWEEVATVESGVTTYSDGEVESETYYVYRVASLTEEGAISTYSNEAVAITRVALPTYAVIDLGDALEQGEGPQRSTAAGSLQSIDLGAAKAKSISDAGAVLLQGVDVNGQEIKGNYSIWRPDGSTLTHSDEKLKVERITKDGSVVGTLDKTRLHGDLEVSETHGVFWNRDTFENANAMVDLTPTPEAYTIPAVPTQAGWVETDWLLTHSDTMGRSWWAPADPAIPFKSGREILWRARATDRNRLGGLVGEATIVYQTRPWLEWRTLAQTDPFAAEHSVPLSDAGSAVRWPAQPQPNSPGWEYLVNNIANFGEATAFAVNDAEVSVGGIVFNNMLPDYFTRFGDNLERTHAMRSMGADDGQSFDDLGTLGDGRYSYGWDINTAGVTVGYSTVAKADEIWRTQGVVWEAGITTATMLPHLRGTNATFQNGYGYAHAINDQGQVVGQSLAPNTGPGAEQLPAISVAALWSKNAASDPSAPGAQTPHWEAHDLNTRITASATETLPNGQTITYRPWHLNVARGVSKEGWIVGTGLRYRYDAASNALIGNPSSFLLLPVGLVDTKNKVLDDGDDVSVEPKKDATDNNLKSIAWIDPHGNEATPNAPDMPQLALRFRGMEALGLTIKWKLKVEHKRRNGRVVAEDNVLIPAAGDSEQQPWHEQTLNGVVEIFAHADWTNTLQQKDFFGGDAELTYQLLKSDNTVLGSEDKILFYIGGKNPDDAKCKTFITQTAIQVQQPMFWFAYAIAKHESKDYNEIGSRYNQFWDKSARFGGVDHVAGEVLWVNNPNEEPPKGFGLFQVTGNASNESADIPRKQLWNWQENVKGGLAIVAAKRGIATRYFERIQQRSAQHRTAYQECSPPSITVGSRSFFSADAIQVYCYNGTGAHNGRPARIDVRYPFDPVKPCGLGATKRWFWNAHSVAGGEPYIKKVERELDN